MRQRGVRIQHALNQGFNFAAAGFLPKQPRAHHFGVVEHQHIACVDVSAIGDVVGERRIGSATSRRLLPRVAGGFCGDKVLREGEVKIGKLHGGGIGERERGGIIRGLGIVFRLPLGAGYAVG